MTGPAGRRGQPGLGQPGPGPRQPRPDRSGPPDRSRPPDRSGPPDRSRLTTRAAVLAVVLCAIALSLAYPVREYIAQRRQIDQLEVQRQAIAAKLSRLQRQAQQLRSNAYVEQQAENKLHMCMPAQTCYVVINPQPARRKAVAAAAAPGSPWYQRLWTSVQQADKAPAR